MLHIYYIINYKNTNGKYEKWNVYYRIYPKYLDTFAIILLLKFECQII